MCNVKMESLTGVETVTNLGNAEMAWEGRVRPSGFD